MCQDLCYFPSLSQSANICVYIELCSQSVSACSKKTRPKKKKKKGRAIVFDKIKLKLILACS